MTRTDASRCRLVFALGTLLACMGANAQGTGTGTGGGMGTTTPELQAFTQEVTVPLTSIGTTLQANFPEQAGAAILAGLLEIRQQATFNPTGNTLTITTFLVRPGSANPTPASDQEARVDQLTVAIDRILFANRPARSIVFIGTAQSSSPASPFGDITGSPVVYSAGYTAGTPARFTNTTLLVPGVAVLYAANSTGTLTFRGETPGGGSNPGTNQPLVANAGPDVTTVVSALQLNGSTSTDPNGGTLTYSWRSLGRSASINNANTATPTIQLGEGFGPYRFELTVTNASGATATDTVDVFFTGRF